MSQDTYCVDASSFFELKIRFPKDVFPSVWERVEELIRAGRLISAKEVLREIETGRDELVRWTKTRKQIFLDPLSPELELVKDILKNFPHLGSPWKQTHHADPFIIALAKLKNDTEPPHLYEKKRYVVVTEESQNNPNRIPSVCRHYNVQSFKLLELFRRENWQF